MTIEADGDMIDADLSAELNAPQNRDHHRVVVRRPVRSDRVAIATLAGKLRHELEHVRQWHACGWSVFELSRLADWVLTPKLKGLPSGNVFTNLKPVEQDANAASSMFLRNRWPESIAPLLVDPEHGPLVRSLTPPGALETLATRMVAFLYLYEDLCAALEATWAIGFAEHLDHIEPGAGDLWRTLQSTSVT